MQEAFRDSVQVLFVMAIMSGCSNPSMPSLRPISSISAQVRAVPELGIVSIDQVDVPTEHIATFAHLVTPTKLCAEEIRSSANYHVADVTIRHSDGTETTLIVRWTGANPAAISLDDRTFYYGGSDAFPDGATRIVRLLNEYKYNSFGPSGRDSQ